MDMKIAKAAPVGAFTPTKIGMVKQDPSVSEVPMEVVTLGVRRGDKPATKDYVVTDSVKPDANGEYVLDPKKDPAGFGSVNVLANLQTGFDAFLPYCDADKTPKTWWKLGPQQLDIYAFDRKDEPNAFFNPMPFLDHGHIVKPGTHFGVFTDPLTKETIYAAHSGEVTVTLCLPQDVQTEAFDYPEYLFEKRVWTIPRIQADTDLMAEAAEWIRAARKPLIVAGGGVHYSEAHDALCELVDGIGIPVAETQAGKGSLLYDHPLNLGALGATGTPGANILAREADLVIGIGTRYSDFTTASNTAFQNPEVRFINLNVAEVDAYKLRGLPLVCDAKAGISRLLGHLGGQGAHRTDEQYRERAEKYNQEWDAEVARIYSSGGQGEVIGVLNEFIRPQDVVICAAGSLPGDLHKLWRTREHRAYHLEYGYSCMGYEIAAGLGVKQADPEREVYVMVGDGSFLMMHTEIVTMVAEGIKVNILVLDNQGYASIGGLSKSVGSDGFGTKYRKRTPEGLTGEPVEIDFAANCASLGAAVFSPSTTSELKAALQGAQKIQNKPVCICLKVDRRQRVGGYESWWDVPVAEVSDDPEVQKARQRYQETRVARRP